MNTLITAMVSLNIGHCALSMNGLSGNYQGNAVINYTEADIPFTRIIEHKHFDSVDTPHTIVTREYPAEWQLGDEPYYPVNDDKNMVLYKKYRDLAKHENIIFGGRRLAEYKYYDMHQVIKSALNYVLKLLILLCMVIGGEYK